METRSDEKAADGKPQSTEETIVETNKWRFHLLKMFPQGRVISFALSKDKSLWALGQAMGVSRAEGKSDDSQIPGVSGEHIAILRRRSTWTSVPARQNSSVTLTGPEKKQDYRGFSESRDIPSFQSVQERGLSQ